LVSRFEARYELQIPQFIPQGAINSSFIVHAIRHAVDKKQNGDIVIFEQIMTGVPTRWLSAPVPDQVTVFYGVFEEAFVDPLGDVFFDLVT